MTVTFFDIGYFMKVHHGMLAGYCWVRHGFWSGISIDEDENISVCDDVKVRSTLNCIVRNCHYGVEVGVHSRDFIRSIDGNLE